MTGRSPWPIWLWIMDGVIVLVAVVAAMGGLFMPALILDIASFWPLYVLGGVAGLLGWWWLRRRRARAGLLLLLPPVLVAAGLVPAIALHFAGWAELPSAAGNLGGPDSEAISSADLAVSSTGELAVRTGGELLYSIELARRGGSTGVPEALESVTSPEAIIRVREATDSFWFQASGWELWLAVEPVWTLNLEASEVEADLRGIGLLAADLEGAGVVDLPIPKGLLEVRVAGDFLLSVPSGVPVEIVGSAAVPEQWIPTGEGWRSPTEGEGVVIVVLAGPVEVLER